MKITGYVVLNYAGLPIAFRETPEAAGAFAAVYLASVARACVSACERTASVQPINEPEESDLA